jgi:hypothetical protein
MLEDERPFGFKVLVELHTVPCVRKQPPKCRLAPFERLASQVVAIQFDQVEGIHKRAAAVPPLADQLEHRDAVVTAGDCFTVDDAGA